MGKEGEWQVLPLNENIAKTCDLAAVALSGKILLFGGSSNASYNMYLLSEEGALLEDLSGIPNIPGYMCTGPVVVQEGKIYVVGWRDEWNPTYRAMAFDGLKWAFL